MNEDYFDIDDVIDAIEQKEKDSDMKFSLYSIPNYYNEEESSYDYKN